MELISMPNPHIDEDGNQYWYLNGLLHKEDGPAYISKAGYKIWYINGKRHNENGPAVIHTDGSNAWYLNGKEYTEDAYRTIQFFNGIKLNG
jgi:hypothetical protein